MPDLDRSKRPKLQIVQGDALLDLPQIKVLAPEIQRDIRVVSRVLPFRLNNYVINRLIDWDSAPDDPIYRLTLPHRDMLAPEHYDEIAALLDRDAPAAEIREAADRIRWQLDPHPGQQLEKNTPEFQGQRLDGIQHKYRETVLVFPSQGQTCHAYCGYCFRWAQFVGIDELKQAHREADLLHDYLGEHPAVSDVLFTGGDPMVMTTRVLRRYVDPLLSPELEHVRSIRFGSKALGYWPHRFLTDPDADDLLRMFEDIVKRGKHVAFMAHFTHPQELETEPVERAIRRIRSTGAVIRTQSPIVRHVNDSARAWRTMWRHQIRLGLVPYYMFVERDTGASRYFEIPLVKALEVYRDATSHLSGLARSVRGPSMSAAPGKVTVDGVATVDGQQAFVLRFLQGRNPDWVGRPFFAKYDERATWLDDLKPLHGERFFFENDDVQDWRELDLPSEETRSPFRDQQG